MHAYMPYTQAELFPNATTATVVVYDAEIDTSLLHLDGAPMVIWQHILGEAWKQSKVDALIAAAQQRYPTYAPLIAAIAQYRAPPAPSAPASPDQPATAPRCGGSIPVAPINVNTGGDFVGRDKKSTSYTVFNQTGQTVYGPQTTIEGASTRRGASSTAA